jgi:hypothetical protein
MRTARRVVDLPLSDKGNTVQKFYGVIDVDVQPADKEMAEMLEIRQQGMLSWLPVSFDELFYACGLICVMATFLKVIRIQLVNIPFTLLLCFVAMTCILGILPNPKTRKIANRIIGIFVVFQAVGLVSDLFGKNKKA